MGQASFLDLRISASKKSDAGNVVIELEERIRAVKQVLGRVYQENNVNC